MSFYVRLDRFIYFSGRSVAPRMVAESILKEFSGGEVVEKVEIAGAGFINVWLNKKFVSERIRLLLLQACPPPPIRKRMKVVVDLSSPNVAKEMHVGHLR